MKTALSMSIASSRFANCMFLALSSGLDTDRGLDLAQALVNNPVLDSKINDCRKNISNGETFSEALLHSNIFSKMYSSWIAIGSKPGLWTRSCSIYVHPVRMTQMQGCHDSYQ